MSYRIAQDFNYTGRDYWDWRAWIEGTDTELQALDHVVWVLHPSFRRSRVKITDRGSGFLLATSGWGTFLLRAELHFPDKSVRRLSHPLRLEYPEEGESPPLEGGRPRRIYLSYSKADSREARSLRESLSAGGLEVLDSDNARNDASLEAEMERLIRASDAVVAFVGSEPASLWVVDELRRASRSAKPSFALVAGESALAGLPKGVQTIPLNAANLGVEVIRALGEGVEVIRALGEGHEA